MTSFNKTSGFITLTVVLIIVLLITALSLMTGKMLMGEQRSASNQIRYHEAINAAQFGLDKTIAQLMDDFDNQDSIVRTALPDSNRIYYSAEIGNVTEVAVGSSVAKIAPITSMGRSGYSADSDDAESQITLRQQVISLPSLSGTPAAPLTLEAGSAIGGNLTVVSNPNGGGAGVPLSIWSKETITEGDVGGSFVSCGLQEYANNNCTIDYSYSNKTELGSDILSGPDANFPGNLVSYVFSGAETMDDVVNDTKIMYPDASGPRSYLSRIGGDDQPTTAETVCQNVTSADYTQEQYAGRYIIKGSSCDLSNEKIGTEENPIQLVIWNGELKMNSNTVIWGMVFVYSENGVAKATLNGGAVLNGLFVSNASIEVKGNGNFNAVYNANVINNLAAGSNPVVAIVPGSWRDW